MSKRVLALVLMVACFTVISSDSVFPQSRWTMGRFDRIFGVHFSDDKHGFAVGNKGLLVHTVDGGETWEKIETSTLYALNDVCLVDNEGWIAGDKGLILHSQDKGMCWQQVACESKEALMAISFTSQLKGTIVGEMGTILRTEDGGKTWKSVNLEWFDILPESSLDMGSFLPALYDVFFVDESHGWIAGEKGVVLSTNNGGAEWIPLLAGTANSFYSVFFGNNLEGFISGQDGTLLLSDDGGRNWTEVEKPSDTNDIDLYKVTFCGSDGLAVGEKGVVLYSSDKGRHWGILDCGLSSPLPWFVDAHISASNSFRVIFAGQKVVTKRLGAVTNGRTK